MKIKLELSSLGIISGNNKRVLETYTGGHIFDQRKTYDEYSINVSSCDVEVDLNELMNLSGVFSIVLLPNCVLLGNF